MAVVLGLTGGIASGKSTVSKMLKELGLAVIDADEIAKEVVEVGKEAYLKIIEMFGEEIVEANGEINRPKLAHIIFHNEEKRMLLNSIVHPAVRKKMKHDEEKLIAAGSKTIILDIPLLFESNLSHLVEKTILVYVDYPIQLERLMKRNHLDCQEAKVRIASQIPLIDKVPKADAVINNNGTIDETKKQLLFLLEKWDII